MASKTIGVLRAEVSANAAGFARDMESCRSSAANIGQRIERSFDDLGRSITRSMRNLLDFRSIIAGVSLASISYLYRSSIEAAEAIVKTADAAGISTTALQEYRYAAEMADINTESLDGAMKFFVKTLGQARSGSGALAEELKKVDPQLLRLIQTAPNTEAALDLIFKAMGNTKNAADRAALSAAAFGRSAGVDMVNMVKDGAGSLADARAEAHDFGMVLDENLVRNAERAGDSLGRLSGVIKAQFTSAAGAASPAVEGLADRLAKLVPLLSKLMSMALSITGIPAVAEQLFPSTTAGRIEEVDRQLGQARASLDGLKQQADQAGGSWLAKFLGDDKVLAAKVNAQVALILQLEAQKKKLTAPAASTDTGAPRPGPSGKPLDFGSSWSEVIAGQKQAASEARKMIDDTRSSEEKLEAEEMRLIALKPALIQQLGSEGAAEGVLADMRSKAIEAAYAADAASMAGAQSIIASTLSDSERMNIELQNLQAQKQDIIVLTGSEARASEVLSVAQAKIAAKYSMVGKFAEQASSTIASGLADAILEGKAFHEVLQQLAQDLLRIAVQLAMMQAVKSAFIGLGFMGAAKGGVVEGGRMRRFAAGGVVDSPTIFPLRSGLGMAGEAGAEGIMPLKRVGGVLGVRAEIPRGGGGNSFTFQQYVMLEGADFGNSATIDKIVRAMGDRARAGAVEVLNLAGLLNDQASLNSRRSR